MTRPNDSDGKRSALAEGYKIADIKPRSHTIDGPKGHFLIEGGLFSDESISHEPLGTLNITKATELAIARRARVEVPIDRALLESSDHTDLDEATLSSMTIERMNEPLFIHHECRRPNCLVDGAHRLRVKNQKGFETVRAYHLPNEALPLLQIRARKLADDGSRSPAERRSVHCISSATRPDE
jgi:hypothetical protein